MSTKQKLLNGISAHSIFVTFGIGLAITLAIGTAIGMGDHSILAFQSQENSGSNV